MVQGRWEVHRILQGGMGVVFIVYDREWREAFAAKTFQDEVFARNPNIKDRFEKEALAWVNLDLHENITEARLLHVIGGKPFLFLEYISGGDLGRWIGTSRLTDDLPQVLRFSIQFCDGMQHVASKGIKAHRDIKPQNCLITSSGVLKITDFGLAKIFDDAISWGGGDSSAGHLSIGLSQTGSAAGTWTHMSPEQFEDAKRVDVRADIYSFGIMLFQMVTGELPFIGRTFMEFATLHMRGTPPIHKISNRRVRSVIEKCLRKTPRDRYQDFDQLRRDLASRYEAETGVLVPKPMAGDELTAFHLVNKGNSLGKLGRTDDSLACFDKAISLNPSLAEAWLNKGATLFENEKNVEALTCFERALALKPDFEVAWANKGRVLAELERHEDAVTCYANAVRLNPKNETAWFYMGRSFGFLGRREDVVRCADRALELDAEDSQKWSLKAQGLYAMGRYQDAIACLQRAASLGDPDAAGRIAECRKKLSPDAELYFITGSSYQQEGRNADAIACYEKGLAIDPSNAQIWNNKGAALLALNRGRDAIACFDRAIALNPRDSDAWNNKGYALFFMNEFTAALPVLEEAQRLGATRCESMIAVCRDRLRKL